MSFEAKTMAVELTSELEAKLERLAVETGRTKDEFVQDAMAGYFEELERVQETLDTRYDDLKSGKARLVPAEEVVRRLRAKSAAWRV